MNVDKNALKYAAMSGMIFRFAERISAQLVSMIVTIVLARILMPEDYAVVSVVTVIINLCNVFVASGLGVSLVQKNNPDKNDYSTIFWTNLFLSILLYWGMFFVSPLISRFYGYTDLTAILRVMALRLPLAAINSVQNAYVNQHLMFKKFFYSTLFGTFVSGVVGILVALQGIGPWALVVQYLLNSVISTIVLLVVIKWRPSICFSFDRLKSLFGFGAKTFLSSFLDELYEEIRTLVIGRCYTKADLSYYTKGKQYPQIVANNVSTTISHVLFPILAKCKDDQAALKSGLRRSLRTCSYVMFPLLIGFAAVSDSFVLVLLTEKWSFSIPYMAIFCIMYLFKPLKNINKSSIVAMGDSGIELKIGVVEKIIGVALLTLTLKKGVMAIAVSALFTYVCSAIMYALYNSRKLDYSLSEQLQDIIAPLLISVVMFFVVKVIGFISMPVLILLFVQILVGGSIYLFLSIVFKVEAYMYIKKSISQKLHKKRM